MQSPYRIHEIVEKAKAAKFQFDSRLCTKGSVFVALETGQRSGMDFVRNAIENGAEIVISQRPVEIEGIENIVTEDSLLFMQELAAAKFEILKNGGTKTICLTGSVGKTTTKELIYHTLSLHGKAYATEGNYNNHIGLPLTVLNCPPDVDFLVLEMGMNHAGEIAELVSIAPCDFRLITNSGTAHSGNFENGETGVLHAKFELFSEGSPKCFVSRNLYERFAADPCLQKKCGNANIVAVDPKFSVSYKENTTIFSENDMKFTLEGIYSNAQIEMFCVAIALIEEVVGQKITEISLPPIKGRGNFVSWHGIGIINESYNSSPDSLKNALSNFARYSGKKLCILGEMRELGANARILHEQLESDIARFDAAYLIGEGFKTTNPDIKNMRFFADYTELKNFITSNKDEVLRYNTALVKASHGVNLWKLFDEIFVETPEKT